MEAEKQTPGPGHVEMLCLQITSNLLTHLAVLCTIVL